VDDKKVWSNDSETAAAQQSQLQINQAQPQRLHSAAHQQAQQKQAKQERPCSAATNGSSGHENLRYSNAPTSHTLKVASSTTPTPPAKIARPFSARQTMLFLGGKVIT
jgi:hypothetical protein